MDRHAFLRVARSTRTFNIVGDVYYFLATGAETDGKYATFEALVPPGGGPPPHIHTREEESFYILEGTISFFVEGQRLLASAGTFAQLPVGVAHAFRNETDQPARMLVTIAPAGLENFFFEIGKPLPDGSTAASPPTPEDIQKLIDLAPQYGIQLVPPA